jgi:3-dehydrosphinganine reductase
MYTPGYTEENKTKPKITLKIEETDGGLTAEQAADGLFRGMPYDLLSIACLASLLQSAGVENGDFHISAGFLGSVFRCSTRGSTPHNNAFVDAIYSFIGWVSVSARSAG